jgi:hypothetical protein
MLNKDINLLIRIMLFSLFILLTDTTLVNAQTEYDTLYNITDIVGKYEHGGKGYQAVSKDSYGGYSYGKWQISTKRDKGKPSTFDFFLKYTETHNFVFAKILKKHGGYEAAFAGKKDFIKTWKIIANNPDFQKVYDNFIIDTQIIPVYVRMNNSNNKKMIKLSKWGLKDKSIEAAINSTVIQHGQGGGYNILYDVMKLYNPKSKKTFLKCLYEYRKKKFPKYKTRYVAEYKDLYNFLVSGNSKLTS